MTGRVFVAGASGVLGRRVVPALVATGWQVTANVRNAEARRVSEEAGARAVTVDLFDPAATAALAGDHDAVVNVTTAIPTGPSGALRRGWRMNDRIRSEASANLAGAMSGRCGRYVGESITFPYVESGVEWIDEDTASDYHWGNDTCRDAEASAQMVTDAGGIGVILRFAMFFAEDSAHVDQVRALARRGIFALPGSLDGYTSWIHVDDAADAVVAALGAPAGVYNAAEPDPMPRRIHAEALAASAGRVRLRALPPAVAHRAGAGISTLARSQRISSTRLFDATGWRARHDVVAHWAG